jgi:hypothetical protein
MTARSFWLAFATLATAFPARADEVDILMVDLTSQRDTWRAAVTLRHHDEGWQHYADAWRLVSETGTELARRVLGHPHVEEQPFTRSLDDVTIPPEVAVLYVEAHDSVHGWARRRVRVDLQRSEGDRYRIRRPER